MKIHMVSRALVLASIFSLVLSSCVSDVAEPTLTVVYLQTGCADEWGYDEVESKQVALVEKYFENLNVVPFTIQMDNGGDPDLCLACFCHTGRRFIAKIKKSDWAVYEKKGFTLFSKK